MPFEISKEVFKSAIDFCFHETKNSVMYCGSDGE